MSTWLGEGMPRYLIKLYVCVCLRRYFLKRFSFEFLNWLRHGLPQSGWASFNLLRIWIDQKGGGRAILSSELSHLSSSASDVDVLGSWAFKSGPGFISSLLPTLWFSGFRTPDHSQKLGPHNNYLSNIYILWVLLLWRTLTYRNSKEK